MRAIDYVHEGGDAIAADLHEYGFCVIKNHPIPFTHLEDMQAVWRDWFVNGKKPTYLSYDPRTQAGYFPPEAAETAQGATERDRKAYFQVFEHTSDRRMPRHIGGVHNQEWIDKITNRHWRYMSAISKSLLYKVWTGTRSGVVRNRFSETLSELAEGSKQNMLRVIYYPPVDAGDPACRAQEHTDINLLTIIPIASAPGLQLELRADGPDGKKGDWIAVPHDPSYMIINAGDMLEAASGGHYPSVKHRVIIYDDDKDRVSMPFFVHARSDARIAGEKTAGEMLNERLIELGVAA